MSAFSIAAIDKLIQLSKKPASMEDPYEGKPPFSFYPPLYLTPPVEPQRPSSPPSPSPYVVNFKRRGPVKKAHAHGAGETQHQDPQEIHQIADIEGSMRECALSESYEEAMNTRTPERNLSLEFGISGYCGNVEMAGNASETGIEAHRRESVQDNVKRQGPDHAFEKMIMQSNYTRLEHALNDGTKFATGSESSRFTSPRTSTTFEEFFDAPDAPLDDSASEDEASSPSLITRMLGKSAEKLTPRLQEEMARRIRAEEALRVLQWRWNAMAKKCSLIGISITSGEDRLEPGRQCVQDLHEQFSEKLVVARLVGGAVASAAVRAAKDEELEGMVARKNQEISRLWDKLQYVELVNREMSQRNQEAIEISQRRKRRHRKRQKWALGCFCSALCLGSAGLLCYKFLPWDKAGAWTGSLNGLAKVEPMSGESCSTS